MGGGIGSSVGSMYGGGMLGRSNSSVKRITLKNPDGSVAGSITITGTARKKTKPLKYNFKEMSVLIMGAKTSGNAMKVLSKARSRAAMLRQKVKSDEYDSRELENALAHALKLEKVAKKRMKHLQQEEKLKQQSKASGGEAAEAVKEQEYEENNAGERELAAKERELRRLMREYEQCMQETMQESMSKTVEAQENSLLGEILETAPEDMSPEDLESLKKRHRAKELKEIMEADLQYLRAEFDRLAKEKQNIGSEGGNGNGIGGGSGNRSSSATESGVSLELAGREMPVQTAEAPAVKEGGNVDVVV